MSPNNRPLDSRALRYLRRLPDDGVRRDLSSLVDEGTVLLVHGKGVGNVRKHLSDVALRTHQFPTATYEVGKTGAYSSVNLLELVQRVDPRNGLVCVFIDDDTDSEASVEAWVVRLRRSVVVVFLLFQRILVKKTGML